MSADDEPRTVTEAGRLIAEHWSTIAHLSPATLYGRIRLAESLLAQRFPPHSDVIAVQRALQGWTVEELAVGERRDGAPHLLDDIPAGQTDRYTLGEQLLTRFSADPAALVAILLGAIVAARHAGRG